MPHALQTGELNLGPGACEHQCEVQDQSALKMGPADTRVFHRHFSDKYVSTRVTYFNCFLLYLAMCFEVNKNYWKDTRKKYFQY